MAKAILSIGFGFIILMLMPCITVAGQKWISPRSYYFSMKGDDQNKGTLHAPFKSLSKLEQLDLQNGDSILLKSGDVFEGTLKIENKKIRIVISSFGKGIATVNGGNKEAIIVSNASQIKIQNLTLMGSGRKNGNTSNGCSISNSKNIQVDQLTISGFQKAGLYIFSSQHLAVNNCIATNNGASGILVDGTDKTSYKYITIRNSKAIDNPGDPTNFTNHSGNGILVGLCTKVLIDHCEAYNNGWDMPRIGNGPVGIWTYESDSVVIQNCISHHNKTSQGGSDGGGFDLDGGVTNSIIQNCESFENEGAGYGIYQYAGASIWNNNKIINCSSSNDGLKSGGKAAIYIWNSSQDQKQFKNLLFKNNRIINRNNVAIKFDLLSNHEAFKFIGNTFSGKDSVVVFNQLNEKDSFYLNKWASLKRGKLNNDALLHQNIIQPNIDLQGFKLNAHGAGILFYNNYYYLYGEVKAGNTWLVPDQQWECYRVPAGGIACYRSKDLKNWTNMGVVLAPTIGNAASELDSSRVIERPRVIYNERTRKFVMWIHLDKNDYSYAHVGVAISDQPEGPYQLVNSFRPNGEESRDMTLFKDADGKAYLFNASENNNTMHVNELTDDYLQLKPNDAKILVNQRRESPAVFKYQHKYYLITSLCTGWAPNKALYAVADQPMGPWEIKGNPCRGNDAEMTYGSQISYIQSLKEDGKYLVLADAWDRYDLKHSTYLWMQLYFEKVNPVIISSTIY